MVKVNLFMVDGQDSRSIQSSGTGDPGQGDHSMIRTHNLLIESQMLMMTC